MSAVVSQEATETGPPQNRGERRYHNQGKRTLGTGFLSRNIPLHQIPTLTQILFIHFRLPTRNMAPSTSNGYINGSGSHTNGVNGHTNGVNGHANGVNGHSNGFNGHVNGSNSHVKEYV